MLTKLIDATTVARELRGGAQGLVYKAMTGADPSVTHDWSTTTTLDDYNEGNLVGRVGVRIAPAALVVLLILLALELPLRAPQGVEWVGVAYLGLHAALVALYDPLAGLYRLARRHPDRALQTAVWALTAALAGLVVVTLPDSGTESARVVTGALGLLASTQQHTDQ